GVGFRKLFPHIRSNKELKKLEFESFLPSLKENIYMNLIYKSAKELENENIFFSGEDFSNSSYVVDLVNHIFPNHEIEVICYVRNPIDFASSGFQQRVKGPGVHSFNQEINFNNLIPDYRKKFEPYVKNNKISKLHIKEYKRTNLIGGDVIDDIAKIMKLKPNEYNKVISNESVDGIVVAYTFLLKSSKIYKGAAKVLNKKLVTKTNQKFLKIFESNKFPKIILCGRKLNDALKEKKDSIKWIEDYLCTKFQDTVNQDKDAFYINDEYDIFELAKKNISILENLKIKIKLKTDNIGELSNRLFLIWFNMYTNLESKNIPKQINQ
ncbi:hypothetical protein OA098_01440, partial [Prochlorococcus sp. AH-736-B04]|nr:hypothetical protein [Prochlorococcus sp. AH-736-B04]